MSEYKLKGATNGTTVQNSDTNRGIPDRNS